MKKNYLFTILAIVIPLMLLGCGTATTPTAVVIQNTLAVATNTSTAVPPTITATPDLCAQGNIKAEVDKVHNHMREFDDASTLAAYMSKDKVGDAIPNLQRIRREAEDQPTPGCLTDLKTLQIAHMNSVINTLIAFMGGGAQESISQGIAIAGQQHDQYLTELARVLGLVIITATVPSPAVTP